MPVIAGRRGWRTCVKWVGAVAVFLACGCSVGPDFVRPTAPTGARWLEAQQAGVLTEPAIAERFTVYAPAHPGFGAGQGIEHLDDILDFALYYLDFLDEIGV